jgi:hypothetical protein
MTAHARATAPVPAWALTPAAMLSVQPGAALSVPALLGLGTPSGPVTIAPRGDRAAPRAAPATRHWRVPCHAAHACPASIWTS